MNDGRLVRDIVQLSKRPRDTMCADQSILIFVLLYTNTTCTGIVANRVLFTVHVCRDVYIFPRGPQNAKNSSPLPPRKLTYA